MLLQRHQVLEGIDTVEFVVADQTLTCVGFIADALLRHIGQHSFEVFGKVFEPLVLGMAVMLVEWLILWWMYWRKIFLRI